jgi:phosphoribosylformylglycinamidine cyclo-ligase
MAHITGGGLLENLPRTLPPGCGATIRRGSWPVPPILQLLVAQAELDDAEAFRVFNMGVGMALVVDATTAEQIRTLLPDGDMIGEIVAGEGVYLA